MSANQSVVALLGSTGFIGSAIAPVFLEALKQGRIKELRILSTKLSEKISPYVSQGAKFHQVDFTPGTTTLKSALKGADVVISALGTPPEIHDMKILLLDALKAVGVKAYIPSEFGTNHYTLAKFGRDHPIFKNKRDHVEEAKAAGIKTAAIACGLITEHSFGPWFGFNADKWSIIGDGDVPVAMSSVHDVARLTLEVAVKLHQDPNSVPDVIDFHSSLGTLKEYAAIFDEVAGKSTSLEFSSLEDEEIYRTKSQLASAGLDIFPTLLRLYMAAGGFNNGKDPNGNKLFNPDEKVWKLRKIEDFAKETGGRPVKAG